MGALIYEGLNIGIDDRTLAHLQIVVVAKLRRGESFLLSWRDGDKGDGRSSVWLHPAIPLQFKFFGRTHPEINHAWLNDLTSGANSPLGLVIAGENGEQTRHFTDTVRRRASPIPTIAHAQRTGAP